VAGIRAHVTVIIDTSNLTVHSLGTRYEKGSGHTKEPVCRSVTVCLGHKSGNHGRKLNCSLLCELTLLIYPVVGDPGGTRPRIVNYLNRSCEGARRDRFSICSILSAGSTKRDGIRSPLELDVQGVALVR